MNPPACFLFTGNTEANRGRGHPLGVTGPSGALCMRVVPSPERR